jgi:branched-chain amino acid transport system substrate-binding protein
MSKGFWNRLLPAGALALAGMLALSAAAWADTIKVGIIGPFSGPFALQGKNFQAGAEAWLEQNGKTVAGHEIELIYRDLPTANPQQARALAQELIVRDKVQ